MQEYKIPKRFNSKEFVCQGFADNFQEFIQNNKANLSYANLFYANLSYANLSYANLSYANLSYANLSDANLSEANLSYANLSYANLSYANLYKANLSDANLSNSICVGVKNIETANVKETILPIFSKWAISWIPTKEKLEDNLASDILIKIGCKDPQSISWWDSWFSSEEEFETKRDTFEFKMIQANYEAVKAYVEFLFGNKKG